MNIDRGDPEMTYTIRHLLTKFDGAHVDRVVQRQYGLTHILLKVSNWDTLGRLARHVQNTSSAFFVLADGEGATFAEKLSFEIRITNGKEGDVLPPLHHFVVDVIHDLVRQRRLDNSEANLLFRKFRVAELE